MKQNVPTSRNKNVCVLLISGVILLKKLRGNVERKFQETRKTFADLTKELHTSARFWI